jgi:hypothetical protein
MRFFYFIAKNPLRRRVPKGIFSVKRFFVFFSKNYFFLRTRAAAAAAETIAIAETTPIISSAPVLGFFSVEEEPPLLPAEPEPVLPPTVTLLAERM